MKFLLLFTVHCLLFTGVCFSQSRFSLASEPDAWLTPVTIGVAVGGLIAFRSDTSGLTMADLSALDRADVLSFDRPATMFWSPEVRAASDIAVGLAVLAPVLVLTEFQPDYGDLMGMYLQTLVLASSLPQYTKAMGRMRPLAYNESAPLEERMRADMKRSFFSGHTSISTAAGIFLATVYDAYRPGSTTAKVLWVAGAGIGLTSGALRVFSGMHFPSDVAAGFIVGAAVGYAIPQLHKRQATGSLIAPSAPPPMVTLRLVL
ncbi:MAG: phosphatase PAP2 family protein [Bacteroidetes bacterium]|jgi:membrane-associated phospholipid phosphatase|nr:phosphatase PAP2 family protein [Bacteroidota bacterium]